MLPPGFEIVTVHKRKAAEQTKWPIAKHLDCLAWLITFIACHGQNIYSCSVNSVRQNAFSRVLVLCNTRCPGQIFLGPMAN